MATEWRHTKYAETEIVSLAVLACRLSGQQQPCVEATSKNVIASSTSSENSTYVSDNQPVPSSHTLLKRTFLDHIAELFACSKEAHFISASALNDQLGQATVYIARNEGFEERDRTFRHYLQSSLIHSGQQQTKKRSTNLMDLLVQFYLPRVVFHAGAFCNYFEAIHEQAITSVLTLDHLEQLHRFDCLFRSCITFHKHQPSNVSLARAISSGAKSLSKSRPLERALLNVYGKDIAWRLLRHLRFVGRIRTIQQTFIECAKALPNFSAIEIRLVSLPRAQLLPSMDFRTVLRNVEQLLDRTLKFNEQKLKRLEAEHHKKLIIHAEMQMLFFISRPEHDQASIFPYIGISKKPCYLCDAFLKADSRFKARPSHGQIHPNWTLPRSQAIATNLAISFYCSMATLTERLQQLICDPSGRRYSCQPESTIAPSAVHRVTRISPRM